MKPSPATCTVAFTASVGALVGVTVISRAPSAGATPSGTNASPYAARVSCPVDANRIPAASLSDSVSVTVGMVRFSKPVPAAVWAIVTVPAAVSVSSAAHTLMSWA